MSGRAPWFSAQEETEVRAAIDLVDRTQLRGFTLDNSDEYEAVRRISQFARRALMAANSQPQADR